MKCADGEHVLGCPHTWPDIDDTPTPSPEPTVAARVRAQHGLYRDWRNPGDATCRCGLIHCPTLAILDFAEQAARALVANDCPHHTYECAGCEALATAHQLGLPTGEADGE